MRVQKTDGFLPLAVRALQMAQKPSSVVEFRIQDQRDSDCVEEELRDDVEESTRDQ